MFGTNSLYVGNEAIKFQVSSTGGKALEDIFRDVYEYVNSLDYNGEENLSNRRRYRMDKTMAYARAKMAPAIQKVCMEHFGLDMDEIILYGGHDQPAEGFFAIDVSMDDVMEAIETRDRVFGSGNIDFTGKDIDNGMTEMYKCLNLDTSKITKSTYGNRRKIRAKLFFDVNMAFLVTDILPSTFAQDEKGVAVFTPEELTAIVLHEIGHILSFIELTGDMFATHNRYVESVQNLRSKKDFTQEEIDDIVQSGLNQIAKLKKTPLCSDKSINDTFVKYLNKLEAFGKGILNKPFDSTSLYNPVGAVLSTVIIGLISIILVTFGILIMLIPVIALIMIGCHMLEQALSYVNTNKQGNKANDIRGNRNNAFMSERLADEFAVRHGYGEYQIRALNKLHKYKEYCEVVPIVESDLIRNSTLYAMVVYATSWIGDKLFYWNYFDPTEYENAYNRNRRILENMYAFFKKPNIPDQVAWKWIGAIDDAKRNMEKAKKLSDTNVAKAMYRVLSVVANPLSWYDLVAHGSLDRDVQILTDHLDAMYNNPLFYQSAKLRSRGR